MPNSIRLSPGGIVPKEMNARQWDTYAQNARADYIKSGQTDYDTGTGYFLGDHNGTPKLSIGNSAGNKITWDGTTLSITGSLVLASGYFIRSGQTAYDTGTGFWLGNDSGTPKLSIGNSAGNKLTWNGSLLAISGSIDLANTTQTFTPTWLDFSSNPTGTISYMDLGKLVIMWSSLTANGTSDDQFMRWDTGSIPSAIRPTSDRLITCEVLTGDPIANQYTGGVAILTGGGAVFTIGETNTYSGLLTQSSNIFVSTGPKGLPSGWLVIYPK